MDFWNNAVPFGRVLMHVQNPRKKPLYEKPSFYDNPCAKNVLSPQKQLRIKEYRRGLWEYNADLYEWETPTIRPGNMAIYLSRNIKFEGDTSWSQPIGSRIEDILELEFSPQNKFWQATMELTDLLIERYKTSKQIGMLTFSGPSDWIASLIGTENLCTEAALRPKFVKQAAEKLTSLCVRLDDIIYKKISSHFDGCCNWLPMWGPRRVKLVQDDTMILFSPEMYQDIFGTSIKKLLAVADNTIFHFHDGAVHHLNWLIQLSELDAIQFGHDPSCKALTNQIETIKTIQQAGKGVFISVVEPEDVKSLIMNLNPRGLLLLVHCKDTEQSKQIIGKAYYYTQERLKQLDL